jgi:pimeloyl-ACP methyl ester carboxylesterase
MAGRAVMEEVSLAGMPATLARPVHRGPWPTLVFVNGVTARGRRHPTVRQLAETLARIGHRVVVPDPPGLSQGALSLDMLAALRDATLTLADDAGCGGSRIGLLGVSVGATMALLVAEQPATADRISIVGALAPCTDFANAARLATTATQIRDGRLVVYRSGPLLRLVAARSLLAALPAGRERALLEGVLPTVDAAGVDPLEGLGRIDEARLSDPARRVLALLTNRLPERFDELYAALPAGYRSGIEQLSPLIGAARLQAPVELAIGPGDTYFPLEEAYALARAATTVRVTVTRALAHADTHIGRAGLADLARIDGFLVRILRATAEG